jgi:hypothetical protein
MASNPPSGAMIDYALEKPARKAVELSIREANGALVRRYSSVDPRPNRDPAKSASAPEWILAPAHLETSAGMHRFVWPICYAKPATLADGDTDTDGVWAPPGRYTVELAVDGRTFRAPLTIAPDPRVHLDNAVYAEQFALARKIESDQERLAIAASEAKQLHKGIAEARKNAASDTKLLAALDAFDADVVARAGLVDASNAHNAWSMPPTTTTNLRFVGETLGTLATAVEGADAAPTPDAIAGYAAAKALLDRALADWQALTSTSLAAVNAELRRAGRKPLSLVAGKANRQR